MNQASEPVEATEMPWPVCEHQSDLFPGLCPDCDPTVAEQERRYRTLCRTRDRIIDVLIELRCIDCDIEVAGIAPYGTTHDLDAAVTHMVDVLGAVQQGIEGGGQ